MRSGTNHLSINTARADALFASTLQRSDDPSTAQIRQAIITAIRAAGARGCAAQVAQAYGEHPETAMPRMRWARAEVTRAFGGTRDGAQPESARTCAGQHCAGRHCAGQHCAGQHCAGPGWRRLPRGVAADIPLVPPTASAAGGSLGP